jgi:hypothetical protein
MPGPHGSFQKSRPAGGRESQDEERTNLGTGHNKLCFAVELNCHDVQEYAGDHYNVRSQSSSFTAVKNGVNVTGHGNPGGRVRIGVPVLNDSRDGRVFHTHKHA